MQVAFNCKYLNTNALGNMGVQIISLRKLTNNIVSLVQLFYFSLIEKMMKDGNDLIDMRKQFVI